MVHGTRFAVWHEARFAVGHGARFVVGHGARFVVGHGARFAVRHGTRFAVSQAPIMGSLKSPCKTLYCVTFRDLTLLDIANLCPAVLIMNFLFV